MKDIYLLIKYDTLFPILIKYIILIMIHSMYYLHIILTLNSVTRLLRAGDVW